MSFFPLKAFEFLFIHKIKWLANLARKQRGRKERTSRFLSLCFIMSILLTSSFIVFASDLFDANNCHFLIDIAGGCASFGNWPLTNGEKGCVEYSTKDTPQKK